MDATNRILWLLVGVLISVVGLSCGEVEEYDASSNILTGEEALVALAESSRFDDQEFVEKLSSVWMYDGGSFNGSIYYVSFECETAEDCWQALSAFGAPERAEFKEGIQTRFAVNWNGPSYYHQELTHPQWNLQKVESGMSFERATGDRSMEFWAVDFEKNRVFYHYESGGFPIDPPGVTHRDQRK